MLFFPVRRTIIMYHLMRGLAEMDYPFHWAGDQSLWPHHLLPVPRNLMIRRITITDGTNKAMSGELSVFSDLLPVNFHNLGLHNLITLDSRDSLDIDSDSLSYSRVYFKCQLLKGAENNRTRPFPYSTFTYPQRKLVKPSRREIFFLGWDSTGPSRRREIISKIKGSGLPFTGGLFSREELCDRTVPEELNHPRLYPVELYEQTSDEFQVHLCLQGNGPLSFRLYELMSRGHCVISEPLPVHITPVEPINQCHILYMCKDLSDLLGLCDYYLNNELERNRIGSNAYDFYWTHLSPVRIAEYFLSNLEKICPSTNTNALNVI